MSRGKRTAPLVTSPAADLPSNIRGRWAGALVFCVTLVAYLPALQSGFVWDDDGHVTRAELRPFGGLARIWFEPGATEQYYPLLHTIFWIEHRLWGDHPAGYHAATLFFHACAALLFALVLRRLFAPGPDLPAGNLPGKPDDGAAWLAAFIFALHPVCVESVAWISEQKNTLSTLFYLAAALVYLRYDAVRAPRMYAAATGLFGLALLSKSVTATLPGALLVALWWRRGRLSWRSDVRPLIPWFALGAAVGLFSAWVERHYIGAEGTDFEMSAVQRFLVAGRVIWFYLGKLLWPSELIFIYPRWRVSGADAWQYAYLLAAAILVAGVWLVRRRARGPLAAVLFFAGSLFPVLGFFNVYAFVYSFVTDHWQYLPSLGIIALGAAGLMEAVGRLPVPARRAGLALVAALPVALGILAWRQCGNYRDLFTFYEAILAKNPECWMAHNNLAEALSNAGRTAEAIPHLERALQLRPDFPEAENNLGADLRVIGRPREAVPHLERALQLEPGYLAAQNNLGIALMACDRAAEGIAQFEQLLQRNPNHAQARYNLGLALAFSGRPAEAIKHFAEAVRLEPANADAELSWAAALTQTGRFPEAVAHFERALQLRPGAPNAHNSYGRALSAAGRLDEAIAHFETALRLDPGSAETHMNLALALRQTGRMPAANFHYHEALRLNSDIEPGSR